MTASVRLVNACGHFFLLFHMKQSHLTKPVINFIMKGEEETTND